MSWSAFLIRAMSSLMGLESILELCPEIPVCLCPRLPVHITLTITRVEYLVVETAPTVFQTFPGISMHPLTLMLILASLSAILFCLMFSLLFILVRNSRCDRIIQAYYLNSTELFRAHAHRANTLMSLLTRANAQTERKLRRTERKLKRFQALLNRVAHTRYDDQASYYKKITRLEEQCDVFMRAIDRLKTRCTEVTHIQNQLELLSSENISLTAQLTSGNARYQTLSEQHKELLTSLGSANAHAKVLQQSLDECESQRKTFSKDYAEARRTLQAKLDAAESSVAQLKSANDLLVEELATASDESRNLRSELNRKAEEVDVLVKHVESAVEMEAEHNIAKKEAAYNKKANANLEELLKSIQRKYYTENGKVAAAYMKIYALEEKVEEQDSRAEALNECIANSFGIPSSRVEMVPMSKTKDMDAKARHRRHRLRMQTFSNGAKAFKSTNGINGHGHTVDFSDTRFEIARELRGRAIHHLVSEEKAFLIGKEEQNAENSVMPTFTTVVAALRTKSAPYSCISLQYMLQKPSKLMMSLDLAVDSVDSRFRVKKTANPSSNDTAGKLWGSKTRYDIRSLIAHMMRTSSSEK